MRFIVAEVPPQDQSDPDKPTPPPGGGQRWLVLKFGGTSVSSADRWQAIEAIARARVANGASVLLVCSAVAGVTDLLHAIVSAHRAQEPTDALVGQLRERHETLGSALGVDADALLADEFTSLQRLLAARELGAAAEAEIIGHGERLSTRLGHARLAASGLGCAWVDARDLLTSEPQLPKRSEHYLSASCACTPSQAMGDRLTREDAAVIITQGFIARSPDGETVLLGRGGSDTSAAYLACLLAAERLEIWTDVPGLFTANPRLIPEARMLERVGYREAQALGALGANVLHPRALEAVWEHGVPVELGWTERPDFQGTCINASRAGRGVKAITSRRNLAMFSLRRPPSWQPVGFLADVAACFAARGLSMDLVSSSCSEIRATVDLAAFPSAEKEIPAILTELERTCHPRVIRPVASVSIVGEGVSQAMLSSDSPMDSLAGEAVYMVVHAANEHHVSVVLDQHAAEKLERMAHERLLGDMEHPNLGPTWAELTRKRDELTAREGVAV